MSSPTPTQWAVFCPQHGRVYLRRDEYDAQMSLPNNRWTCPRECGPPDVGICGATAEWDDDTFDTWR